VRVGDVIDVTLPETATTGFRWEADVDPAVLEQIGSAAHAPTMPRGAPGSRTLSFVVRRPGEGLLHAVERRPWEAEPSDQFAVELEIAPEHG